MNTTRLISALAAAIAALAALAAASPAAAQDVPGDLTFDQASALFSTGSSIDGTTSVARNAGRMQMEGDGGAGICWYADLLRSAGTWPYVRRLYLYTLWCGSGGTITYRSSSVRTDHTTLCWNENGPHLAKVGGGAGWPFVDVQASVDVACHSPVYFVSYHDTLMMRIRYFPNGVWHLLAYS